MAAGDYGRNMDESTWYCNTCWDRFAQQSEAMKQELPAEWYVDGGQTWEWVNDKSQQKGTIEFDKKGTLQTTFGEGRWEVCDSAMQVSFGYPAQTWQLLRVPNGFTAKACESAHRPAGKRDEANSASG